MLSSDFANLTAESKRMIDAGADWLHMDVMVSCVSVVMATWTVALTLQVCVAFALTPQDG